MYIETLGTYIVPVRILIFLFILENNFNDIIIKTQRRAAAKKLQSPNTNILLTTFFHIVRGCCHNAELVLLFFQGFLSKAFEGRHTSITISSNYTEKNTHEDSIKQITLKC